ncbi:hypothetical protein L3Q65_39555 [Amycolatopsis sp. FU40]|uniref:hypothetical protein n=1 Tax=Amycolatopsis sp. FU40 TaxID=2914159 RepID=UPI001F436B99|nr:hypothetical protein [Amycolatopsis sp. FU40]UKD53922.1 hypothetical protein L3Q65_39555 [Amycolatopsis sp. FU40]
MGQDSVADGVKGKVKGYDDSLGQNASDMAKKAPIVGKGYSTISGAVDKFGSAKDAGDIAAASGQLVQDGAGFVAGAAVDVASFAVDPIGWLVSNGLNMLIELVQPLQDALHFVTGDGPGLKRASENFTEIGKGFVMLADQFVKDGDEALKDWQGEGGDAAKKALAQFSQGIKGIGTAAGAVADTLQMWSMVMTVIEEVVKALISDLVSWLIYLWLPALAASVVSFGASVATAMTTSIAKVASVVAKVTKHLGKLGKLLDKFVMFLVKWSGKMADEGIKLTETGKRGLPAQAGKVAAGALAADTKTRAALFGHAAKEAAESVPKKLYEETIKEVTGTSPGDLSKGPGSQGKAAYKMGNKIVDYAKNPSVGDGESIEETRGNLDMGE